MFGIDGTRNRGGARRRLRSGGRVLAGTALLTGALLGVAAQPAHARPDPNPAIPDTSATPPPPGTPTTIVCGGLSEATAVAAGYTPRYAPAGGGIVLGGPGPDWMIGSNSADILDGQGGNDLICGRGGNDDLRGLSGDDRIWGHGGFDQGDGGGDNDVCDATTEQQTSC